jgi:hypothetical protein
MCDHPEKYLMGYRVRRAPGGAGAAKKSRTHAKKSIRKEFNEFSDEDLGIFSGEAPLPPIIA